MAHITHTHTSTNKNVANEIEKKNRNGKERGERMRQKNQHCNLQFAIIKFSM